MTETSNAGPMSMVKIDGAKIKQLREQQGLTQLYLATAVEVTTDTISRWENKRYPSIKRDNGLKLAAALNVSLEELLDETTEDDQAATTSAPETILASDETRPTSQLPTNDLAKENLEIVDVQQAGFFTSLAKRWPLLVLSGVIFAAILAFGYYVLQSNNTPPLTAHRILPPHCIANQPFPVLIQISGTPGATTALILKEKLPPNSTIHSSSPNIASGVLKYGEIKWLQKIEKEALFSYMISLPGQPGDIAEFRGTASIASNSESPITGLNNIAIGLHHWADTDKDNVINDDEILTVYDRYSELPGIEEDIDLVEEIWMGSSYAWDEHTASFKIID